VNAEREREGERKLKRKCTYAGDEGKRKMKREVRGEREREREREKEREREREEREGRPLSAQPAVPSAADRFIEWHVPIRSDVSFCTFLFFSASSASSKHCVRREGKKSPQDRRRPVVSPLPPSHERYRLAREPFGAIAGCVLPLWTFLDDSRMIPGAHLEGGRVEGERRRSEK